jgi:hypothetical protein
MTGWLIAALISGLLVGLVAQHERQAWELNHGLTVYVPPMILTLTPSPDQPGVPQTVPAPPDGGLPLAWRVPWLSGLVGAGIILGIGTAAKRPWRDRMPERVSEDPSKAGSEPSGEDKGDGG